MFGIAIVVRGVLTRVGESEDLARRHSQLRVDGAQFLLRADPTGDVGYERDDLSRPSLRIGIVETKLRTQTVAPLLATFWG